MKKRTTKKRSLRGAYEQNDLELYLANEGSLYPQRVAIEKALDKKVKSGKFDKTKAPKAFSYWVDAGARKYAKEFGMSKPLAYPKADRDAVAKSFAEEYMAERGLKGLKGRGMRGLGDSSDLHEAKARDHLARFDKIAGLKSHANISCANGLGRLLEARRVLAKVDSHIASMGRKKPSKELLERAMKADMYFTRMETTFSKGCLVGTPRVALSGARRKRKAKR